MTQESQGTSKSTAGKARGGSLGAGGEAESGRENCLPQSGLERREAEEGVNV